MHCRGGSSQSNEINSGLEVINRRFNRDKTQDTEVQVGGGGVMSDGGDDKTAHTQPQRLLLPHASESSARMCDGARGGA